MPKFNVVVIALTTSLATISVASANPLQAFARGHFHATGKLHNMRSAPPAPTSHIARAADTLRHSQEQTGNDNSTASPDRSTSPTNDSPARDESSNQPTPVAQGTATPAPNENTGESKTSVKAQARAQVRIADADADPA